MMQLYDFETQMENAMKSVLETGLAGASPAIKCQVVTTVDPDVKETPRIEVVFATGPALQQMTTLGQSGAAKQVPCAFRGQFTLTIFTSRPQAVDDQASHGIIRGLTRFLASAGARAFHPQLLPWLQILEMLPASTNPIIFDGKAQAGTELSYAVVFAIQNSAWPGQG